jgi:hypothetical protein
MKVKVIIEKPRRHSVRHVAEVRDRGDLLKAVGEAMEEYRTAHHDVPLFDHSVIRIERA